MCVSVCVCVCVVCVCVCVCVCGVVCVCVYVSVIGPVSQGPSLVTNESRGHGRKRREVI